MNLIAKSITRRKFFIEISVLENWSAGIPADNERVGIQNALSKTIATPLARRLPAGMTALCLEVSCKNIHIYLNNFHSNVVTSLV